MDSHEGAPQHTYQHDWMHPRTPTIQVPGGSLALHMPVTAWQQCADMFHMAWQLQRPPRMLCSAGNPAYETCGEKAGLRSPLSLMLFLSECVAVCHHFSPSSLSSITHPCTLCRPTPSSQGEGRSLCVCACVQAGRRACVRAGGQACMQAHVRVCMRAGRQACMRACMCTCMRACTRAHACTHMHACIAQLPCKPVSMCCRPVASSDPGGHHRGRR